ncbi:MAG: cyclopropane-fatty-acyl-phospholipid synthase family protein [Acidobacteriota bacterium]
MSWARKALFKTLAGLREAHLTMTTPDGLSHSFGDPQTTLRATIHVHNERFFSRTMWGGDDGAGDAFLEGDWTSPDPVSVVRLAVRNLRHLEQNAGITSWVSGLINRFRHLSRANTLHGSRRNIAAHYDLSNEFFGLFLDQQMLYSSAIFPAQHATLEDAQVEKMDRLCRKLRLAPGDRVLEIGTGWGAFALHAARKYGCHVTTTTISRQQHDLAAQRFQASDVRDRVLLLLEDYRLLRGQFDKIASIEMFEAVGFKNYDKFFTACDRLLAPNGAMAMQTITMNEQRFKAYRKSGDWIQRHIFPGGELASLREIQNSLARCTALGAAHFEDIGMHYAHTLAEWRRRFHAASDQVRALGFDEKFLRMWDYYLAYCEGAFRERYIGAAQLLLVKNGTPDALYGEPWQSAAISKGARA